MAKVKQEKLFDKSPAIPGSGEVKPEEISEGTVRAAPSARDHWFRKFFLVLATVAVCGALGTATWYFAKDRLFQQEAYRLRAERINVPPQPAWIPKDFVETVLKNSGLDLAGSLLGPAPAQRLSQAFSADSWVEEVQRVEIRFPSGADVRLTYRSPVALVEVPGAGLFPVDRKGVLLRTDYFIQIAPEKKHDYPKIVGIGSKPLGTVGTPWGDPLVHAAAEIAYDLADLAAESGIVRIRPVFAEDQISCQLETGGGSKIIWGTFEPNDSKTEGKKQRLRELLQLYQSLDRVPPSFQPIQLGRK